MSWDPPGDKLGLYGWRSKIPIGIVIAKEEDMAKKVFHVDCVDLSGVRGAKDGSKGFPAKYSGYCGVCGKTIHTGDRITFGGVPKVQEVKQERYEMAKVEMKIGPEILVVEGDKAVPFAEAIVEKVHQEGQQASVVHLAETKPSSKVATAADLLADALAGSIMPQIEKRLAELEEKAKNIQPLVNIIVLHPVSEVKVELGLTHQAFEKVLQWARLGQNVWMTGPAAAGKTTIAEQVAKALGRDFACDGARWDAYGLSGFMNAQGTYVTTNFRKAFENGWVYLLDECDACEPSAMLWLNQALANGHCSFPDGMVKKHQDFVCLCAANTIGLGATQEYVGRLRQDAAFLDRFVRVDVAYDNKLERALAQNDAWVTRVQYIRQKVQNRGLKVIVSPRSSIRGAKALANGVAWDQVEHDLLQALMTPDQWASVGANHVR